MLKIRLMRIGAKKKPFYRVVVVEERSKRTGGYIELLGSYDPLSTPKDIKLNKERIEHWIKQGAQPSVGYLRIIGKAIQRQPRKAKKEKKVEAPKASTENEATKTPVTETSTEVVHPKDDQPMAEKAEETQEVQSTTPEVPAEESKQEAETNTEPTPQETK